MPTLNVCSPHHGIVPQHLLKHVAVGAELAPTRSGAR
jgi:hypothetical protein